MTRPRGIAAIDHWLLSAPSGLRVLILTLTVVAMFATVVPHIPRAAVDFSHWPWLSGITQPEQYGTDTIADRYEARIVRHDVWDMYTKRGVPQTPLESDTWSPEASSPYPPLTLFALAALAAAGDALGIGLYGAVAIVAIGFLGLSLAWFLRTRWYLFPLLYLNFSWVGARFFFVQDGSYLVMLAVVVAALWLVRRRPDAAHVLMALAITIKLSPIYYVQRLRSMRRPVAIAFVGVLLLGLVVPYFLWDNYLYIYRYNSALKGADALATAGGAAIGLACAGLLLMVDRRGRFGPEDWIGWSLVPAALFFAFKMNVARHLLLVLLVPDPRGLRNVAAAVGLAVAAAAPGLVPLNSILPAVTLILFAGLFQEVKSQKVESQKSERGMRF